MKISALTTCVGPKYAEMLCNSLPVWSDTCDEVLVVTDYETTFTKNCDLGNVFTISTDLFTAHGASFNKGAALSHGFAQIKDPEWILNFDADILPPADWRKIAEPHLSVGKLHGCSHRYREDGTQIPDADYPNIWGFFHLWHVDDPHSWRRPVYTVDCGHAGNYDHTFMMQWPEKERVDLWPEIKLIHQGEPRQQWFGNDTKNEKKMVNLFTLGLYEAWLTKAGHVKVPQPEKQAMFSADDMNLELARKRLKEYTDIDPFKYRLEIRPPQNKKDEIIIGL